MSFSFKPDTPGKESSGVPGVPQVSFGSASAQNLMARRYEDGKGLIQLGLMVIFGAACLTVVVLLGYNFYLSSQIESKKQAINALDEEMGQYPFEEMGRLSTRVKIIENLVNQHPSANAAFRILEESIENPVFYKSFNLNSEEGKQYTISLQGVAPDYKSIAQQIYTYKQPPYSAYLSDVSTENLVLEENGNVSFTLKSIVKIQGASPEAVAGAVDQISLSLEQVSAAENEVASSTGIMPSPSQDSGAVSN